MRERLEQLLKKYQDLAGPVLTFEQVTYKNIANCLRLEDRAGRFLRRKIQSVEDILANRYGDEVLYTKRLNVYRAALEEIEAALSVEQLS